MSGLLTKVGPSHSEHKIGEYNIEPFKEHNPLFYKNDNGMKYLLNHLEQLLDDELEIDFQSGEISNVTEPPDIIKLEGVSMLPLIGILIILLGVISPIFIVIGFLFCFIGWIPMMTTLIFLLFGGNQEEYREEVIQQIEIGGGVYRNGWISGIINGLDTYYYLHLEHHDVSIMRAWEISHDEELNISSEVYSYGGSDDGGVTGRFITSFTPLSPESVTELESNQCPNIGNSRKQVNLACERAVKYGLELKSKWPGTIILESIPQINEIMKKSVNQKKLSRIISKISPENLSDLQSTYHNVKFLNY